MSSGPLWHWTQDTDTSQLPGPASESLLASQALGLHFLRWHVAVRCCSLLSRQQSGPPDRKSLNDLSELQWEFLTEPTPKSSAPCCPSEMHGQVTRVPLLMEAGVWHGLDRVSKLPAPGEGSNRKRTNICWLPTMMISGYMLTNLSSRFHADNISVHQATIKLLIWWITQKKVSNRHLIVSSKAPMLHVMQP